MRIIKNRKFKLIAGFFILVGVISTTYFIFIKKADDELLTPISEEEDVKVEKGDIFADINGDGVKESIAVEPLPLLNDEDKQAYTLVAYDSNGKETARLAKGIFFPEPLKDSFKVDKLISDLPKETIRFDVPSGPHSSETFFFTQAKDLQIIGPVCKVKEFKSFQDCTFWSGELGQLISADIDEDGILEVIELVDEYPIAEEIDQEVETAVRNEFSKQGLENIINDMLEIAKREKGGRGRKVVWNIYRFNQDQIFEELSDQDFNETYSLFLSYWKRLFPNKILISKSQMSKGSYDFAKLMINTWQLKN
ncbi:hypothetical protein ACFLZ1_01215 [Patescibacteria group bacterium]